MWASSTWTLRAIGVAGTGDREIRFLYLHFPTLLFNGCVIGVIKVLFFKVRKHHSGLTSHFWDVRTAWGCPCHRAGSQPELEGDNCLRQRLHPWHRRAPRSRPFSVPCSYPAHSTGLSRACTTSVLITATVMKRKFTGKSHSRPGWALTRHRSLCSRSQRWQSQPICTGCPGSRPLGPKDRFLVVSTSLFWLIPSGDTLPDPSGHILTLCSGPPAGRSFGGLVSAWLA